MSTGKANNKENKQQSVRENKFKLALQIENDREENRNRNKKFLKKERLKRDTLVVRLYNKTLHIN